MGRWHVELSWENDATPQPLVGDLERAARFVLGAENAPDCELSIALVDDETMIRLNRDYLGHDRPTDVIAFPLEQPGIPLVGDIYIGLDQARRQADELGLDFGEELLRLTVHGILHLLGWEHPEDGARDGSPMYVRQEELVRRVKGGG